MENGALFSLLMILFVAILLLLRISFPGASRRSETAALTVAAILFFSLCRFLLTQ
jgi:hypothetical protein